MPKFSAPATCNSFPKIFGGGGDHTFILQIDVFEDYLAMVGDTRDTTLKGLSSGIRPLIAVTSVAIPDYYYWAKVHSLKTNTYFYGVQFSTDGTLLITHSLSSSSYIVVYDAATGAVKSARKYSSGGYENYNYLIKSILVSSGLSPKAYLLSNYIASLSCTGQHLFKFDPLTFSSAPIWIK